MSASPSLPVPDRIEAPALDRAHDLARRREVLLLRSARLRDELREDVVALRHGLRHVDRGITFARSGLLVPIAVGAGVALIVARPSRLLRAAGRVLAYGPVLWPILRPFLPRVLAVVARAIGARGGASGHESPRAAEGARGPAPGVRAPHAPTG